MGNQAAEATRSARAAERGCGVGRARLTGTVLLLALMLPAILAAQQSDTAGRGFSFGIDSRLVAHDNFSLSPSGSKNAVTESDTRLSFGFVTETPQSRLTIDAALRLRLARSNDGATTGVGNGLTDPQIKFAYQRDSAFATLDSSAFVRSTELAQTQTVDDFDGTTGTRHDRGGTLAWTWGEDRRVGFGLNAGLTDSRYSNAPGQADRQRQTLGASLRFDLSQVARLTFGLTRTRFSPDGGDIRITRALNGTLSIERPNGVATFSAEITDTPEGTRTGFSLGREIALPEGSLALTIGATKGVSGKTDLTGSLRYTRPLAHGALTADLSRDVTSSSQTDLQSTITRVNLGVTQDLTPRASLGLNVGLAQKRGDSTNLNGNLAATLTYELGQDWVLDAGLRQRLRQQDGASVARDNTVFLGLRRQIDLRF